MPSLPGISFSTRSCPFLNGIYVTDIDWCIGDTLQILIHILSPSPWCICFFSFFFPVSFWLMQYLNFSRACGVAQCVICSRIISSSVGVALVLIWAVSSISVLCLICKEHTVLFQLPHFSSGDCTSWLKVRLENPFHPQSHQLQGMYTKGHHYQEKSKCTNFWIEDSEIGTCFWV